MPMPPPINRHLLRSALVAFCSRGNHCNGARISRPSANTTRRARGVTLTSVANGLYFIREVVIPPLQEELLILFNHTLKASPFALSKSPGPGQLHVGLQP